MFVTDSSLMGTGKPTLNEGCLSVAQWQQVISYGCCLTDDPVPVPEGLEPIVAIPIISLDCSPLFHRFLDSPFQALCRRVHYLFQPDPSCDFPILLRGNKNQCLAFGSTASLSRLLPTDIHFVHLNCAREPVPLWPDHCPSQFVQPRPGCLIASQSKNSLQAQSTCPILLARYPPDYPKPQNQRLPCPLKKCSCNHRGLMRTCRALKQRTFQFPSLAVTTDRAPEAFRPTQLKQILAARLLCRKALLELRQGFRIVLHTLQYYILRPVQSRGYPYI